MTAKKSTTTTTHTAKHHKADEAAVDTPIQTPQANPPTPAPAPAPAPSAGGTSTATGTGTAASGTDWTNPGESRFVDLPLADFQNVVTQIGTHVQAILALVINPTSLTPDQRKHSGGKLRDGEAAMLQLVLNVA